MGRAETFSRVKEVGIIPAIRSSKATEAIKACEAICKGGIPIIEISLALPDSLHVLEAVVREHGRSVVVGAGTVVNPETVERAASAGAQFIVTPGFDLSAVIKARELNLAMFAGALSPTEVQVASASGADAVKLFPCFANGDARYLKALRGQYPQTSFIASGGVGLENCSDYFRAGACAIGVGGEIADMDSMSVGHYRVFTVRAKRICEAVRGVRALMGSNPQDIK